MTSGQQESLRMRMVPTCTATFPCIFYAPADTVQGSDADGPLCAEGLIGTEQA